MFGSEQNVELGPVVWAMLSLIANSRVRDGSSTSSESVQSTLLPVHAFNPEVSERYEEPRLPLVNWTALVGLSAPFLPTVTSFF